MNNLILESIRRRRNTLLKDSDWTQLPDSPLTEQQKLAWQQYRQQLRDITETIDTSQMNHWDDGVAKQVFPEQPK